MPSRRDLLRTSVAMCGLAAAGRSARLIERLAAEAICPSAGPVGELIGNVQFVGGGGPVAPFGEIVGGPGLDARMFTDLSALAPGRLITPTRQVFIRTTSPPGARPAEVGITGLVERRTSIPTGHLVRTARPMGAHLIECAGNSDARNYGLMSVAEWDGVPLEEVIAGAPRSPGATAVLVSGLDHDAAASSRSTPGASWILPLHAVGRVGAFLAVRMNGEPLTPDHGAPVRLVVPGWYGCAWIKWVNGIRLVGDNEPASAQMKEFASRTHQDGAPALARDFAAPRIDLAATPIRIEKRRIDGRLEYRVVGIVWGGERKADRLLIRFSAREAFVPMDICPRPQTHRIWSVWEHRWRPTAPGAYDIVLKAADPAIRTRRLDMYFYTRRVFIDEV